LKDYGSHRDIDSSNTLKDELEETYQFRINEKVLDPFARSEASIEDAREGIIRVFKLNNLRTVQEQIKRTSKLLIEKQDEQTYNKLTYLKQIEDKLRTELNLLN
jgi:hypothetical protein